MRKPTMHDVAREAGVSIGTVDRVFHKRGRFGRETAERVYAAAERLRYAPNRAASNLSRAQLRRFAVLMPDFDADGGYWRQAAEGMRAAVDELNHQYIDLDFVTYDRFSTASFRESAEALRRRGASGVILAPTNAAAAREFAVSLRRASQAPPIVVFDGELPDTAVLTTISQDSYESGMLAGKLLHWMAGSSRGPALDFLSVTVGRDDFHLRARRRGFEDYAADKPGVSLQHLEIDGADVSPAVVEALAGSAAQSRRPAGIFVTNSAAHQVVEALPRGNRPAVVGYDLIPANVAALREGGIDVLFNQQPQQQGRRAVYALYRYLVLGEAPGPRERISIDLVVPETLDRSALHGAETDRATGKTPDKTSDNTPDNSPDNTPENTPNKPQDKRKESRS